MPRPPRREEAGAVHHVCARGAKGELLYRDDEDCRAYLKLIARVVAEREWRLLAYCLMGNHVHLIVETPQPNLGAGMKVLHGCFADRFNARYQTSGHVFQGPYRSKRVLSDPQMWQTSAYVARNPVKAGLCSRPEEWRWSSYAAVAGLTDFVPAFLDVGRALWYFASAGGDPRTRYVEFVG